MRVRYESFGGIIAVDKPAATLYVDREYMQELGYTDSPRWRASSPFLSAPVTAHFAVTNRCPMACQTCFKDSGKAKHNELSTSDAKHVLDELARMQVFTVAFGGGEPLARRDIFELARFARYRGLIPTLTTNGFYIDRWTARRCRIFDHVHVSLDGIGHRYQATRGVDGFEYASRAITMLVRNNVSVGVNCVVSRLNYDHLEELVRFVVGLGVNDILFLRLKPRGRADAIYQKLRLTSEQRYNFYPYIKDLTIHYGLFSQVDCAMMPFVFWHHPDREVLRYFAVEGCVGANEIIEILCDGRMRGCSFAANTTASYHHLEETWHSDPAFELFRNWMDRVSEPCRSCKFLDLCHGGCHAVAEALTGDFNAADPECPFVAVGRE